MKRLRFISLSIMSFTLMTLHLSCSSENNASGDIAGTPITFSISTASESQNAAITRSSNEPQEILLDPIKMTSDLDSAVYLHTIISDFPVESQPSSVTKGALTTSINSFGVSAYKYTSGGASSATDKYIDNQQATVSSSTASTSTTYYWPNNTTDKLAFYAYTPWGNSDVAVQTDRREIKYSVNTTVTSQQDLLTAYSEDNNIGTDASKTVSLTFNHALTAINFVVGADMIPGIITSISFENIITSGTYTIGGSWSGTSTSTFTYSLNKSIAGTNGEAITSTSGNTTLLMIPQSFNNDNQKIKIVFNDGSADHTLYAALNTTKWEAGKQITYKISSSAVTTLNIGTITFPTAWNSYSFPKTAYANGDAAGIFVVDNNNKVRSVNVKITYNGSKWTPASKLIYSPKYKYFVYYPYNSSLTGAPAAGSSNTSTTAAAFFSSIISNWTISTTQTSSTLISEDLQYAIGTMSSSTLSVSFSMAHGMGLANIVLGSKQVPTTRTFSANSNTSYSDSSDKTTISASNNFDGNTPALISSNYLALVKPNSGTIFKSVTSDPETWSSNLTYNIAANGYSSQTASPSRDYAYMARKYTYTGNIVSYTIPATGTYKLEVWGAQGGAAGHTQIFVNGGLGGYSYGYKEIEKKKVLYIVVGGAGNRATSTEGVTGGYNGGGRSYKWVDETTMNGSGGGATHIATSSGILSTINVSSLYIAAGGGGGSACNFAGDYAQGGYGGGTSGGNGAISPNAHGYYGKGGSQSSGGNSIIASYNNGCNIPSSGEYGKGGNGATQGGAGGGGGYYGGGGASVWCAAGGGSGYIGGVTGGTTTGNVNSGNGYAIITAQFMF